jgi:uncharacterized protein YbaP (TraB family)
MKASHNTFRNFFLLLALLLQVRPATSQPKNYPSLLWEISGNGLTKPSYLYGTMHVSKKVAFHLTDAFFEGLKNTEALALETNPETWLSEIMTEGMSMVNSNLFNNYYGSNSDDFYNKAFTFTIPGNKFIQGQISREPENVNGLLYRFNGYSGNYEEYTYLDLFIFQSARKSHKPVYALEDFKTSMEMLTKASMPDPKETTVSKRVKTPYNLSEKIEDAYRKGDLDALDSLHKLSSQSANFEKYMLTDRNVIMAVHMDSIMKKESLFTAIGAAHLPGEKGVISLLRNMGYVVKPVTSSVSKKSIKTMNEYEESYSPLTFQTQYAADSSFKVEVPGKMFAMNAMDEMDAYLYTDMVNGSYYSVKKIKSYGLLLDQDDVYQTRRIDSMLYESVPGKIVSKKLIKSNNGYSGFDITNKTRRGDLQRYRIFVTDKYIYIFKVSGNSEYVKSTEVDKFFKSITFKNESSKENWVTYSPDFGGYEISVPANYTVTKPKGSSFQKERLSANAGSDYFMCTRSVLHDSYYIEEDTFELSQLAKNYYEKLDFKLEKKEFGTYQSFPCINVSTKKKNGNSYLHLKIVLKDQQYFLLACKSKNAQAPSAFLNSLKFKEFKHESMETYVDTSFQYSVKTDFKERKKTFIETLADPTRYYYANLTKKADYLSSREVKTIESPNTGECVEIYMLKCNDYRMDKSLDDFWKTQTDHYLLNTSLHIKEKKKFEKDGIQGLDLVLTDTNSFKQVRTRMFQSNGLLYILHATGDSISGTGNWTNTFYETFKLKDTVIGQSIYMDKIAGFLADAASNDSTTREKVNALCDDVNFDKKHADELMRFISSPGFNNVSTGVKACLFYKFGDIKDPSVISFLKKEYSRFADSSSIQLAILNSLASQRSEEGNKAFLASLISDSPLSNYEYDIQGIFYPFYDSLKIAKSLFPQLLDITKYPEYKSAVYKLLSTLLDSGIVSSQTYVAVKKDLLRQANDELKRQLSGEENLKGNNSSDSYDEDYAATSDDVSRAIADAMAAAKYAEMAAQEATNYSYVNSDLIHYCNLIGPFYTEPAVKTFFDKAFKTKNPELKISLICILLKNNQSVPDTMINNLAKDIKTRVDVYSSLKRINKENRIASAYTTQTSLIQAQLFGTKEIPTDSIQFITSKYVESKLKNGYIHFYKSTNKKGAQYLNFVAFQPSDSTKFEERPMVSNSRVIYKNDNVNEMIDEVCYEISLTGRGRIKKAYWNNYDEYSDEY